MLLLVLIVILFLCLMALLFHHARRIHLRPEIPEEIIDDLHNPDRGLYHIYDFLISDELPEASELSERFNWFPETSLVLLELDLSNYNTGRISSFGIDYIREILEAASHSGKRVILRFLYDRVGKAFQTEPKNIEIVLEHMRQLEPVLKEFEQSIFTLQGLFIGNWGEMHGSRYSSPEEIRKLFRVLQSCAGTNNLAVRTPAIWRMVTGYSDDRMPLSKLEYAEQIGLFNDGMLSNEYDMGTYGNLKKDGALPQEKWLRSNELQFQDELCRFVPNGGEVIQPGRWNDFENAVQDLSLMHVSYLNADYDREVWNKWAGYSVSEEGVFNGIDGKSYIERHLGYCFVIKDVISSFRWLKKELSITVKVENVGFAPAYSDIRTSIILTGKNGTYRLDMTGNLRGISNRTDGFCNLTCAISSNSFRSGFYTLHLKAEDSLGNDILFGNRVSENGLLIGDLEIR